MAKMVRVNTRVSQEMNDWLDSLSEKTGIPKSTYVMLALERYKQQETAPEQLKALTELMENIQKANEQLN